MPKAKTNNALQKSTAQGRAFFCIEKAIRAPDGFCLPVSYLSSMYRAQRRAAVKSAAGAWPALRCRWVGLCQHTGVWFAQRQKRFSSLLSALLFDSLRCLRRNGFQSFFFGGNYVWYSPFGYPIVRLLSFPRLHHTGKLWYAVGQNPKHFAPMRKKGQEEMIPLPFFMLICPMHRPLALGRNATYFCRITDEACTLPMSIPAFPTKHALGQ